MKRLLSIWISALVCVALAGCTADANLAGGLDEAETDVVGKKPAPQLSNSISYTFVGTFIPPDELLAWEGTIEGDVNGTIVWIFNIFGGKDPDREQFNHVRFYQARWLITDADGNELLTGTSSGSTALPKGKNGIWNGRGVVTEAHGDYAGWEGRHISEGGSVVFSPSGPPSGDGFFRVN